MRGERGFALVITLIVTALLVALAVEFVNETYVDASHSHNFVASQQSGVLAESGAQLGRSLIDLEFQGQSDYSSLLDPWAQPIIWQDETGSLTVTIEQENGKLNLNSLLSTGTDKSDPYPFQTLARNLFTNLKLSPELCDAEVDWISSVDKAPQPNGAKSPYYNSLKPPYDVKGDILQTVEELALIKGFKTDTVAKLKPFVTVYDAGPLTTLHLTKININTAPREVLMSINGLSPDKVSQILDYRKTKPIKTLNDVELSPSFQGVLNCGNAAGGMVFRIHAEGKVGESISVVEAVYRTTDSKILYWREY
jgi:general secretion pathway protein K